MQKDIKLSGAFIFGLIEKPKKFLFQYVILRAYLYFTKKNFFLHKILTLFSKPEVNSKFCDVKKISCEIQIC